VRDEDEEIAAELRDLIGIRIVNAWPAGHPHEDAPPISVARRLGEWLARALVVIPVVEGQL